MRQKINVLAKTIAMLSIMMFCFNNNESRADGWNGEWTYQESVVADGDIYAVEKCTAAFATSCSTGTYRAVKVKKIG